jgi:hypothetical protein
MEPEVSTMAMNLGWAGGVAVEAVEVEVGSGSRLMG